MSNSAQLPSLNIINDRFNQGNFLALGAVASVARWTNELLDLVNEKLDSTQPLPQINLIDPPTYEELDAAFNFAVPAAPSMESFPALPDISNITPPANDFAYSEDTYTSPVEEALKEVLPGKIVAGGTGLGAAVEEGIWNREIEREDLALQESIDNLADQTSENGGFSLPDGVMSVLLGGAVIEHQHSRATSSRDIATKQAELAQKNLIDLLSAGNNYEQAAKQYGTSMRDRVLAAARAKPEIAVRLFEAEVNYINIFIAQYNAIAQKVNAKAEIFRTQMLGYTSQVDTKARIIGASVQKYTAESQGVRDANTSELQKIELLLKQMTEYFALQADALKAITQVQSQVASSALAGMTASASAHAAAQNSDSLSHSTSDVEVAEIQANA
jgi:hypothetical protein